MRLRGATIASYNGNVVTAQHVNTAIFWEDAERPGSVPKGQIADSKADQFASIVTRLQVRGIQKVAAIGEWKKGRVLPFADELEARGFNVETFEAINPADKVEMLDENARWIDSLKASGTAILDIGPSPTYANFPSVTSDFYAMELQHVQGYESYVREWGPWLW